MTEKSIKLNRAETFISFGEKGGPIQIGNIRIIFDKKNDATSFKIFFHDFLIYDTDEKKIDVAFLTEKLNPIVLENVQNTNKESEKRF
ncbi:hypothetical protein FACS1894172_03340 [Spirochaetia bacterium]|nr:hypothetical protein FACS1894172_03340 [Spirochaetia bacterium]